MHTLYEQPVTENTALYYRAMHSRFDAQAEALRASILALPDTLKAKEGGKTYHISPLGDDANDGLTPATAWRTVAHLQDAGGRFKDGDVVLFERAGVYRSVSFPLVSGVSYGAYGDGPKPQLVAGDKNYADPALWERIGDSFVWRTKVPADRQDRQDGLRNDIGNIIFDHGRGCASDHKRLVRSELTINFEFYHDIEEDYLYLFHSMGNPGARFSSIEIAPKYNILMMPYGTENVIVENLCLKYTGAHAIGSSCPKNVVVRGCDIGYIGGSMLRPFVRYGNGVEFFGLCDHMLVENNWIYACYDAGYTHQGPHGWHENIVVRNNLIEYCTYNIEVWTTRGAEQGGSRNVLIEGNILRFAGYGFGVNNRIGCGSSAVGHISLYNFAMPHENVVITGNIFDTSSRYLVSISYPNDPAGLGPTVTGNIWHQQPYHTADSIAAVDRLVNEDGTDRPLPVFSQADMEKYVPLVDLAPTEITFEI